VRFPKNVCELHPTISPALCWRQSGVSDGALLLSSPCLRDCTRPHKPAFRRHDEESVSSRITFEKMLAGQLAGGRLPAPRIADGHAPQAQRCSELHATWSGRQHLLGSTNVSSSSRHLQGKLCSVQPWGSRPLNDMRSMQRGNAPAHQACHAFCTGSVEHYASRQLVRASAVAPGEAGTRPPISCTQLESPTAVADKLITVFRQRNQADWRKLIAFSKQWTSLAAVVFDRCLLLSGFAAIGASCKIL
jgi:hypothetical protein